MYTTKKLIAIILSALMLLSLMAGCGTTNDTPETTEALQGSSPVGILLVSMGAEFQIGYDAEGFAINITGTNDAGRTAAATVTNFMGRDCVHAVRSLLDSVVAEKLAGTAKDLVIRLGMESEVPYEGFLQNIGGDVQLKCDELGSGLMVKLITDDMLTEEGFINEATAKELAAKHAGLEDVAVLEGNDAVTDGMYTFAFGEEGEKDIATVDANTGHVSLASETGVDEEQNDDEVPVTDPENINEEEDIIEQTVAQESGADVAEDEEITD